MVYLLYVLIVIIVIFIYLINKKEKKKNVKNIEEDFSIVRYPRIYAWIGFSGTLFFLSLLILMFIYPNDTAEVWVGVIFLAFIILGLYMILSYINWKVEVYKNFAIYRTIFGQEYKFKYSEIKDVKLTKYYSMKIKTNRRTYTVDLTITGIEVILEKLIENDVIE